MTELTPAQKEAYARADNTVVDLFAIELRHVTFPEPIRLISYEKDVTITLEDDAPVNAGEEVLFIGANFAPPGEKVDNDPGNTVSVVINGISAQALPYLNVANQSPNPIEVTTHTVTLSVDGDEVIGVSRPFSVQVVNFSVSMLSLSMTFGFTNLKNRIIDV